MNKKVLITLLSLLPAFTHSMHVAEHHVEHSSGRAKEHASPAERDHSRRSPGERGTPPTSSRDMQAQHEAAQAEIEKILNEGSREEKAEVAKLKEFLEQMDPSKPEYNRLEAEVSALEAAQSRARSVFDATDPNDGVAVDLEGSGSQSGADEARADKEATDWEASKQMQDLTKAVTRKGLSVPELESKVKATLKVLKDNVIPEFLRRAKEIPGLNGEEIGYQMDVLLQDLERLLTNKDLVEYQAQNNMRDLLNIVANTLEAMPGSALITVEEARKLEEMYGDLTRQVTALESRFGRTFINKWRNLKQRLEANYKDVHGFWLKGIENEIKKEFEGKALLKNVWEKVKITAEFINSEDAGVWQKTGSVIATAGATILAIGATIALITGYICGLIYVGLRSASEAIGSPKRDVGTNTMPAIRKGAREGKREGEGFFGTDSDWDIGADE